MIYTGIYRKLHLTAVIHLPVPMKNSIVLLLCIFETSVCTFICLLCGSKNVQCLVTKFFFYDITNPIIAMLTLNMLNLDISCFKNSVDSDQLASEKLQRSQLIRIYTVFHFVYNWNTVR